jgi:hypothetical protein
VIWNAVDQSWTSRLLRQYEYACSIWDWRFCSAGDRQSTNPRRTRQYQVYMNYLENEGSCLRPSIVGDEKEQTGKEMCRLPMTSNQSPKACGRLKLAVKYPLATSNIVYDNTPIPRRIIKRCWEDICCCGGGVAGGTRREGKAYDELHKQKLSTAFLLKWHCRILGGVRRRFGTREMPKSLPFTHTYCSTTTSHPPVWFSFGSSFPSFLVPDACPYFPGRLHHLYFLLFASGIFVLYFHRPEKTRYSQLRKLSQQSSSPL